MTSSIKKLNTKFLLIGLLLLFVSLLFSFGVKSAEAASVPVTGYAWSSNIGWICFDCGTADVYIDSDTGIFSGYAWSSNIGWINFAPTNGFPNSPLNGARLGSDNNVTGWAKAPSNGGGWDGWIKLSGSWSNGVRLSGNNIIGYAWGGDVVGWINFSNVVYVPPVPVPSVPTGLSAVPQACGTGQINLAWDSVVGATSYQLLDGATVIYSGGATSYQHITAPGSAHNYSVRATGPSGSSVYSSVLVTNAPSQCGFADLVAGKPTASANTVAQGDTITFTGIIRNEGGVAAGQYTNSAFLIDDDGDGTPDFQVPSSEVAGTPSAGSSNTTGSWPVPLLGITPGSNYRVAYYADSPSTVNEGPGDGDDVNWSGWSDPFTVTVTDADAPTANITVSGCEILLGQSTCNTTVSWVSDNVTNPQVEHNDAPVAGWDTEDNPGATRSIPYGENIFEFYDGPTRLDLDTVTASCGPGNSWNVVTSTCDQLPPPAGPPNTLEIKPDKKIIRAKSDVKITWTVFGSTVAYSCTVKGPKIQTGSGISSNSFTTTAGIPYTGSQTISGLTNSSTYTIACPDPNYPLDPNLVSQATTTVEIIPVIQGI